MIEGFYHELGYPIVRAVVHYGFTTLESKFMVDTGAAMSLLNRFELEETGAFPTNELRQFAVGVGGTADLEVIQIVLDFQGVDGHRFAYELEVGILSAQVSDHLPSILGRDILNSWNLRLFPTENRVEADVLHCDYSLENPEGENF